MQPQEGGPSNENFDQIVSIAYSRSGTEEAPNIKMQLRSASHNKDLTHFDDNGFVKFNEGASFPSGSNATDNQYGKYSFNHNEGIMGMKLIEFDVNPLTLEGSIGFWNNPGDNYTENARGFIFKMEKNPENENLLVGCAVAGAAAESKGIKGDTHVSIRRSIHESIGLVPRGFFTPNRYVQDGQGQWDNQGNTVWKQCFKQTEDGANYVVDSSKTDDTKGYDVLSYDDPKVTEVSVPTVKLPSLGKVN